LKKWLNSHLDAAKAIGKPLLFEEFGKRMDTENPSDVAAQRDPVYRATYNAIEAAVEDNEPLLGSMYWKWAFPGYSNFAGAGKGELLKPEGWLLVSVGHSCKPPSSSLFIQPSATHLPLSPPTRNQTGPYGVSLTDSTMKVIRDHSAKMYKLMGSVPPRPSCLPANGTNGPAALGAWFAAAGTCVNDPVAAQAWHALFGPNAQPSAKAADFPAASVQRAQALQSGGQVFPSKETCCAPNTGAFTAGCSK